MWVPGAVLGTVETESARRQNFAPLCMFTVDVRVRMEDRRVARETRGG